MATTSDLKPYRQLNVGMGDTQIAGYTCPLGKTAALSGLIAVHELYDAIDWVQFFVKDKNGISYNFTPKTKVQTEQSFISSGQELKHWLSDGDSLWVRAQRDGAFTVHMYLLEDGQ
jgi:hypothetical protein